MRKTHTRTRIFLVLEPTSRKPMCNYILLVDRSSLVIPLRKVVIHQAKTQVDRFSALIPDILTHALGYLSPKDRAHVESVSRYGFNVARLTETRLIQKAFEIDQAYLSRIFSKDASVDSAKISALNAQKILQKAYDTALTLFSMALPEIREKLNAKDYPANFSILQTRYSAFARAIDVLKAQQHGLDAISIKPTESHMSSKVIQSQLKTLAARGKDPELRELLMNRQLFINFVNSDPEFTDKTAPVLGEVLRTYAKSGRNDICNRVIEIANRKIQSQDIVSVVVGQINSPRLNESTRSRITAHLTPRDARNLNCCLCLRLIIQLAVVGGIIALFALHPGA